MEPESPRTRAEALALRLENSITARGLGPGDLLGKMEDIRAKSGYARSTVSEAVRLLRDRGVIEIRPGRNGGLFVAEASPVVRIRHTLLRSRESPSSVTDAAVVRDALELQVNTDAAAHRTPDDVAELHVLVTSMGSHLDDFQLFLRDNWRLHERIAAISPNELLKAVYLGTSSYVADLFDQVSFDGTLDQHTYLAERLDIHRAMVAAIEAQDTEMVFEAVMAHHQAGHAKQYPPFADRTSA